MNFLADTLRFVAIAQISLISALFWRDRRRQNGAWATIFFGMCIIGYLLVDWLPLREFPFVFWLMLMLPFLAPAAFWLFSKSIFDDHFGWRYSQGWLLAGVVGGNYFAFFQRCQPFSPLAEGVQLLLYWLLQLLSLGFILLAILEAARGRDEDLVLSRLHFRTVFIVATAGLMLLTVFSEISLRDSPPPPVLGFLQKLSIAGLATFFSFKLLVVKSGFFFKNVIATLPPLAAAAPPEIDDRLLAQLSDLMGNQKFWRTEGLTIRQLAEKMEVKEYRLRQAINQHLGYRNFNDYLNGLRVRQACAILADAEKREFTVLEIAYDLGFASLAPFNKAFKGMTGMTPTEWRRTKMSS